VHAITPDTCALAGMVCAMLIYIEELLSVHKEEQIKKTQSHSCLKRSVTVPPPSAATLKVLGAGIHGPQSC
jgi:hypothetical protein